MTGWFPDWQTAVTWLVVTPMASVVYFGSMTRVIDFGNQLITSEVRIIACGLVELVGPCVNDRIVVEVVHGGHKAVLELLFGGDADMAQNRTGDLREEALD